MPKIPATQTILISDLALLTIIVTTLILSLAPASAT